MRPNDSSARPAPSTRRGPATAASGRASSAATSVSSAPGRTIVSGLSSSTSSPNVCRMPRLLARGEAEVAAGVDHPHAGPALAHGCRRAVGRGVVDDDDLVVDRRPQARPATPGRRRCPSRVVGDDDYREPRHREHATRTSQDTLGAAAPRVAGERCLARVQDPRPLGVVGEDTPQRRFDQSRVSTLHVQGRRAVDLARDGRVEHDDRHAGAQRFERRQAEAFVVGQEHERARAGVQRGQLRVRHVSRGPRSGRRRRTPRRALDVETGNRAVVADDLEARVGHVSRQTREAVDELGDMAPIEEGADEQDRCARGRPAPQVSGVRCATRRSARPDRRHLNLSGVRRPGGSRFPASRIPRS